MLNQLPEDIQYLIWKKVYDNVIEELFEETIKDEWREYPKFQINQ
jgi:hypothetical protein